LLLVPGMCRLIASALGALIGCTDAKTPADIDPPVHATRSDGQRVILDEFAIKDQAYLSADGLAGAGDYYYRVTDADGVQLSQDAIECRRVHIDETGVIDLAYDGTEDGEPCQHRCRFSVDGGLTLQLMPYADSQDSRFRVEVSDTEDFGVTVAHAFSVAAP
jgi:hypothetical protein